MTQTSVTDSAPAVVFESPLISNARLKQIYSVMMHCRMLEEAARSAYRRLGSLNEYEAAIGHEAALVSAAMQLEAGDTAGSVQVEMVRRLVAEAPVREILREMQQHTDGSKIGFAAQMKRTLDAARRHGKKSKTKKKSMKLAMAYAIDNTAAEECWHDALRTAHRLLLPMVFVWQSVRLHENSGNSSAMRSPQYGMPIIAVDGNDAIAVYRVAQESAHRARTGHGPTLIECRTYRPGSQHEGKEAAIFEERDPIIKMQRQLESKHLYSAAWAQGLESNFRRELDVALAEYSQPTSSPIRPGTEHATQYAAIAGQK